ncbi:LCP family protein [Streptomyces odontomachi]|uniref:LCP family protein n=1 Tax=Streptomyces odontomachi TaxID=2944940 RepID=UPI00210E2539|nr:LCP family protein [Streptomyces sp. ODS25]
MSDWHGGTSRPRGTEGGGWPEDPQARYGGGSGSAQPDGPQVMRQVRRGQVPPRPRPSAPPYDAPGRPGIPAQPTARPGDPYGAGEDDYGQEPYDSGYSDGQVYGSRQGGARGGGGDDGYPPGEYRPRPRWGRRIRIGVLTLVFVVLVAAVGTYFWADSKLRREVDLSKVIDRPEAGKGTNYLIVGSDSREGMTDEQKKDLHTGSAEGKRTDSMIILHVGDNGDTMVSLPRDSDVEIPTFKGSESGKTYPGTGKHTKLNAAYAMDGPELLVRTIEANTGLHIDHYAEIGFAGFANIVDAVGGVEMNLDHGFKDSYSGADFKAGKQTLNGQQALAFVRTRHAFATSDLQRTKNQQAFLAALAHQVATPSTVLNPFKLYPVMGAGLDSLIVDKDMSLWNLASMFWAMKGVSSGDGKQMNIPLNGSSGGNLLWDKAKVKTLVDELKNDEKVTVSGN